MVTVGRCRAILGDAAAGMSDDEIRAARDQLAVLARVAIRMFLDRKADGVKNPEEFPGKVLTPRDEEVY